MHVNGQTTELDYQRRTKDHSRGLLELAIVVIDGYTTQYLTQLQKGLTAARRTLWS